MLRVVVQGIFSPGLNGQEQDVPWKREGHSPAETEIDFRALFKKPSKIRY